MHLAAALAFAGQLILTTEDAVSHAPPGVAPHQVPCLLKALTDAGWLIRLRRGLCAGTGRLPGGVDILPFVLATALVSPSAIGLFAQPKPVVGVAKVTTPAATAEGTGRVVRRRAQRGGVASRSGP